MRSGRDSSQGFTLLELLVTMGILLIVLTAAYQSYIHLLRGFVAESSSAQAQMETVVNTNLLRLDIAHAGYGLARDLSNEPLAWDNSSSPSPQRLTIRSTVNNLDEATLGWVMCNNSTMIQDNNDSSLDTYVFLDQNEDHEVNGVSNCSALPSGTFLGYPYDDSPSPPSGCTGQPCYNVIYELSSTQTLDDCASGTGNLQRSISGGANWQPVINCVADWQVAFERDTDGDGSMDTLSTDISSLSIDDIYTQIEQIHVYVLVQEGSYERDYTFSGSTSMDGVNLSLPGSSEATHYRWKMMKLSVNPQDL